ncbi:MAG: bacterioferritin-associated ferredoxin [Chromatiales bacterium]|jgi:bacterioferritin-associated ferredoxin|nr:bacterioferritin-associated ferredoxin [Chromatiales bacterium]MDX9767397.1 bacterioferritin-associated ferredoxin [Ectothiorhodospiraceae bacterium]
MYICICKGVTDRQIRHAVENGAASMRELREQLGVCSDCGKCGQCAKGILREHLASRPGPGRGCEPLPCPAGA